MQVLNDIICFSEQNYYIQFIFVNVIFRTSWTMVSLKHLFRNDNAISQIVLVLWAIFVPSNCILRFKSNLKITFCIAIDARMLIWIRPDLFNKSNIGKRIGIRTIWFIIWIADDWPKLSISDWLKCCYDESWQNNPILVSFILSCWNESYLTLGCMEACECNIYFFI